MQAEVEGAGLTRQIILALRLEGVFSLDLVCYSL